MVCPITQGDHNQYRIRYQLYPTVDVYCITQARYIHTTREHDQWTRPENMGNDEAGRLGEQAINVRVS